MGIQGLLPLLKSIQQPITLAELSGNTVGVDAYCWLHKGVYGCALQLAEGKESDIYINYVMRRVNMMLYCKIKPILVFDGGYLPSKSEKEAERRNKRKENRTQGLAHLQNGNRTKALECFQKSIDISPEMAYNVIKACREKGVDCIVAPYEADAQLAYLMKAGITQFTISEDSDLLIYGCDKVVFKMDANGAGLLINLKNLPKLTALRMDAFTEKKFREMCILSGCDYLQSVKGMGLITAHKLLRKHSTVNKLIGTLRLNNKMKVPKDYEAKFAQAEQTFLYQIVFDPNTSTFIPLNPIPEDLDPTQLQFAGHNGKWKQEHAVQLALGNLNPITGKKMGNIRAKVLSLENDKQVDDDKARKKAQTPPSCSENKRSYSVLSSHGEYEAKKNLNGSFKETKSSEKASKPFVTPIRTKKMRSEAEDDLSESSRLAKLYSSTNEEHSVRRRLEDVVEDDSHDTQNLGAVAQLKKRPKNPFRSPVIAVKEPSRPIVSRYFGLSGMETKEEQSMLDKLTNIDTDNSVSVTPTTFPSQSSTDSQDTLTKDTQESDQQTSESSPTENSPKHSNNTNDISPGSSRRHNFFLTETKSRVGAKWHGVGKRRTSRNCENREPPKKKIKSSQTSLHRFAFVKNSNVVNVEKTEHILSPNRSVLGSFSENCTHDRVGAEYSGVESEEMCVKKTEEFTKIVDTEAENERINTFDETQGTYQMKEEDSTKHKTTTLIALRTKPNSGLNRCRSVGLSRRKSSEKEKSVAVGQPLMNYFAYRGRSSSQPIILK